MQADLADIVALEKAVAGVDGIVHFGGFAVEGTWPIILHANIIGCYNLFDVAHRNGVKRVVFASSTTPSVFIRAGAVSEFKERCARTAATG